MYKTLRWRVTLLRSSHKINQQHSLHFVEKTIKALEFWGSKKPIMRKPGTVKVLAHQLHPSWAFTTEVAPTMHPQPGKPQQVLRIHRHRHWWKDISFRWWWQCCTVDTGVAMAWAVLLVFPSFPQYFKGVQCHQLAIKWIIGLFDWLVGIRSCAFQFISLEKNPESENTEI